MFTAFDVGFGILVLISAILATARGLTREILSLATWAGSAAIAIYMWRYHIDLIYPGLIADDIVAQATMVVVSFIVSLIVLHLITMRIADFVGDSKIGPLDRTLGFLFGVARGVVIAIVVVIFGDWLLSGNLDIKAQAEAMANETKAVASSGGLSQEARTQLETSATALQEAAKAGDEAVIKERARNLNTALQVLDKDQRDEIIAKSESRLPDWALKAKSFPILRNTGDQLIAVLPPELLAMLQKSGIGSNDNLSDAFESPNEAAAPPAEGSPEEQTDQFEDDTPPPEG